MDIFLMLFVRAMLRQIRHVAIKLDLFHYVGIVEDSSISLFKEYRRYRFSALTSRVYLIAYDMMPAKPHTDDYIMIYASFGYDSFGYGSMQ